MTLPKVTSGIVLSFLIVRSYAGSFAKVEEFDAAGCAAANLQKEEYQAMDCEIKIESGQVYFRKYTCTSDKITHTYYSDKACTNSSTTNLGGSDPIACTKDKDGRYKKTTCNSAPAKIGSGIKYTTEALCDAGVAGTEGGSMEFDFGICKKMAEFENGNWSSMIYSKNQQVGNNLEITEFTEAACTGTAKANPTTYKQCADLGDGWYTKLTFGAGGGGGGVSGFSSGTFSARAQWLVMLAVAVAAAFCAVV